MPPIAMNGVVFVINYAYSFPTIIKRATCSLVYNLAYPCGYTEIFLQ